VNKPVVDVARDAQCCVHTRPELVWKKIILRLLHLTTLLPAQCSVFRRTQENSTTTHGDTCHCCLCLSFSFSYRGNSQWHFFSNNGGWINII